MTQALDLAERLAAIVATQQEIASKSDDLRTLLETAVSRTQELSGAAGAIIEMIDGDELVYRAGSGTAREHVGLHLEMASSLSGLCVRTGEPFRSDDTEEDARVDHDACRRIGARSMIVVPLAHDEGPIGALKVTSPEPAHFNELDQYSLQLMAGLIAVALSNATEYEAKKASEHRYRILFEECIAGAFHTTVDGRFADCNDALAKMLGYDSREELRSRQTWDLYFDRSDRDEFINELREKKSLFDYPLRLKRKDGSAFNARLNVSILFGAPDSFVVGTLLQDGQA